MSHEYFQGLGDRPMDIEPGIEVFDEHGDRLGTVAEVRDGYVRVWRRLHRDGWLPGSAFAHQQDGRLYAGFPARRFEEFALETPGATNLDAGGVAGDEVAVPASLEAGTGEDAARDEAAEGPTELDDVTPAAQHPYPEP